ncbi:MAG TPA: TonB family protein [Steroidobacteraceae bacterium]|jgi:TonB family protein|nr:TonB family protein [Steroidobacteraceae bacterium]
MRAEPGIAWLLLLTLGACVHAPEEHSPLVVDENTVRLAVASGPRPPGSLHAVWPLKEAFQLREGWVDLNFMVDTHGKTYEVVVTDSAGSKAFEAAAIKAAQKWTFEPAMLAGEPTDSGYGLRVYFTHPFSHKAAPQFSRDYEQALAAIAAGDRGRAETLLAQVTVRNLYEDALISLAKYQFEARWGTEVGQLASLRRAVGRGPGSSYLPRKQSIAALQALLPLELHAKDFASAMWTWQMLRESTRDPANFAKWQTTIDDVHALRTDERAYAIPGEIPPESSSWFYLLYKRRFEVAVSGGHISELKLRCDRQYVSFGFDPNIYYRIADRSGDCRLELIGDPGTRFELIQS